MYINTRAQKKIDNKYGYREAESHNNPKYHSNLNPNVNSNPQPNRCPRYEGRKEMFYLTTHPTRLYGVTHMVKDHSDSETEETRCRHIGYSFRLAQGFFYMHHPTDRITHTTAFVTPVVEHWLEREIAQCPRYTC